MSFMCMLSSLGTDGSTARTKGRMGEGPPLFFLFLTPSQSMAAGLRKSRDLASPVRR